MEPLGSEFASNRTGNHDIYSQAADGASDARVEFASKEVQLPNSFTPDARSLVVYDRFRDLGILHLDHPDHLEPLLHSEFDERMGQISPDGKWIVYESNESGTQFEIILRSFPDVSTRREKISINGGRFPLWGPKGSNEIYYVDLDGHLLIRDGPFTGLGFADGRLVVSQAPGLGVEPR